MEKGFQSTPVDVTLNFFRLAGGGPLIGVVLGIIGSFWLRRLIRDDVLTSTVTFITCFLCFYVAEFTFFKVSGTNSYFLMIIFLNFNAIVTNLLIFLPKVSYPLWSLGYL